MEKTLVIYDNNGTIFTQISGNYIKPVGLQHIEIEIPERKILVGVNPTTQEPILEDVPKTEAELLREELEATQLALAELAETLLGGA